MTWNWQQPTWPDFRYKKDRLEQHEADFLYRAGLLLGTVKHLSPSDQEDIKIELISTEALKTSEIEGEILNRDSLQSSVRKEFGLAADDRRASPAEQGIAEMMVDAYRSFSAPLNAATLFRWHRMLTQGRQDLRDIGRYRTHGGPMQVVSGRVDRPTVHFEAPPSSTMSIEMKRFIEWFNRTSPRGAQPLPALARSGLAHLRFVSIHPFEDGNGRIDRAVSEKALAQNLDQPSLIALAHTIEQRRKGYYSALQDANKAMEATPWLLWFADTVLEAQQATQTRIEFLLGKTKFLDRLQGALNARQIKAVLRLFREGPQGFKGGLSAENYITITKTSRATATRDLQDLVEKGALKKVGERKHTRYSLNLRHPY